MYAPFVDYKRLASWAGIRKLLIALSMTDCWAQQLLSCLSLNHIADGDRASLCCSIVISSLWATSYI